jgi:AGCS family alanine or glycine:cation symporter
VGMGGPGAVLWMWVIGFVGMALKMTEVTQAMLYRDTSDPDNPHGGPMFVAREGFKRLKLRWVGSAVGGVFVATLVIATVTGGNMFQAWNVADVTFSYFGVPQIGTGIVLAVTVGLVIIGGIKRIGAVAARIVPVMCLIYLLCGTYVLIVKAEALPGLLAEIVTAGLPSWAGGKAASAQGAFLGGSFGCAAMWGIKRALFSSGRVRRRLRIRLPGLTSPFARAWSRDWSPSLTQLSFAR